MTTIGSDPVTAAIRGVFAFNDGVMGRNLADVGEREARSPVGSAGNSISWILGHVVYWRQQILEGLGGPPLIDGAGMAGYRGTSRDHPPEDAVAWDELVAAWERSTKELGERLDEAPPAEEADAQRLLKLAAHETYHAGQIGLARRAVGLPGVV